MKVLIIPDKFKGTLSSGEAGEIIASGLAEGYKMVSGINKEEPFVTNVRPMADGGEGTLEVIAQGRLQGGERDDINVVRTEAGDPLGRRIIVPYLLAGNKAYIEMARVSGLQLLDKKEYNPLITTTYGLGEVIVNAVRQGAEEIVTGIGGSATNDGGMGMLRALGYIFYDSSGNVTFTIGTASEIKKSDKTAIIDNIKFTVASDVENPLLGSEGASRVFSPQKGADRFMVRKLESDMRRYADLCERYTGRLCRDLPGAGSAGGTGFAFMTFLNAGVFPGWKFLFETAGIENEIADCDLVITGEGFVDSQSFSGKLLSGVLSLAKKYSKRVWVFCGDSSLDNSQVQGRGIERLFRLTEFAPNRSAAISEAGRYLKKISYESATFL